ncbi:hypothetical protein O6H91_Y369300 [Diphasiastrum complanatum]|nr:hypothetical protein O6H91_Y369300 [Diphasiastrum complanatum]
MTTTSDILQGEIQLVDASKKLFSGGEIVVVKPTAFIEFFRSQMEPPSSPIGTRTNPRKSWIHNLNSNHKKSINLDRTMLSRSVHSKHYTVSNITCLNDVIFCTLNFSLCSRLTQISDVLCKDFED